MDLNFKCEKCKIEGQSYDEIIVDIKNVDSYEILSHFTIEEIIKYFEDDKILDKIGEDRVIEYFNLSKAPC